MSNMLILAPTPIAACVANRGTGALNLLSPDPKEVWADSASAAVTIELDLGAVVSVDTLYLGAIRGAAPDSLWSITGGVAGSAELVLQQDEEMRAPGIAGTTPDPAQAFWHGAAQSVRFVRIVITPAIGSSPMSIGVVMLGKAFRPTWNHEWGSGRRAIDMGTATPLASGGFSIVPGARKTGWTWTLGDLTDAERDELHEIALAVGETSPVLVCEDPDNTPGLHRRLHYGLFRGLKPYERRNVQRTRWDFTVEECV